MKKPLLKLLQVFAFLSTLIFFGCGAEETASNNLEAINYLNEIRKNTGMIEYTTNNSLDQSAYNHSRYLGNNNLITHDEISGYNYFTGTTPSDRAVYAGYNSRSVGENIATASSEKESIDNLFTAIYHRIGFLSFIYNEIGFGQYDNIYTYNMGNSGYAHLCENNNDTSGQYYYNICADLHKKVPRDDYNSVKNSMYNSNPDVVVFPYDHATDIPPVFYEESPDPLPNHSMSGNPVSIHLNPKLGDSITLNSLTLRESSTNTLISNSFVMKKANDPNEKFTLRDYALFPYERLDWGTTYTANATYTIDGNSHSKNWSFTTRNFSEQIIEIDKSTSSLTVDSGTTYVYYIKTNKRVSSTSYSYDTDEPEISRIDTNTFYITLTGSSGQKCKFVMDDMVFDVVIS